MKKFWLCCKKNLCACALEEMSRDLLNKEVRRSVVVQARAAMELFSMTDQEPAEEEREKARSPDDGLGAAGGGGLSSLALPGTSSAPASPSHSSSSLTRAKENGQQFFEEDSRGRLFDWSANVVSVQLFTLLCVIHYTVGGVAGAERKPSPHAHLVDLPPSSDCEDPETIDPGLVNLAPLPALCQLLFSEGGSTCRPSACFSLS